MIVVTTRRFAPINCCGWLSSRFLAAVGIGLRKLGLYDLEQMYSMRVAIHFGCEKHMKSAIDRLFGWTKAILRGTIEGRRSMPKPGDMVQALRKGFIESTAQNPLARNVFVGLDISPVSTNSTTKVCKNWKISRPRVFKHMFKATSARTRAARCLEASCDTATSVDIQRDFR